MGTTIIHPDYDLDQFGGGLTVTIGPASRTFPRAIVAQICRNADARGRPRTLDLAVAIHESGGHLNPFVERHADNADLPGAAPEDSYGILQINTRVPGRLPGAMYLGLDGLVRAQELMEPRWQEAFVRLGGWAAYVRDVYWFLSRFAPLAQGSVGWDEAMAREAHAWAWVLADVFRGEELSTDPRIPHLIGALDIARQEVAGARASLAAVAQRLSALEEGIAQTLS